jgi:hypothetical protein
MEAERFLEAWQSVVEFAVGVVAGEVEHHLETGVEVVEPEKVSIYQHIYWHQLRRLT